MHALSPCTIRIVHVADTTTFQASALEYSGGASTLCCEYSELQHHSFGCLGIVLLRL